MAVSENRCWWLLTASDTGVTAGSCVGIETAASALPDMRSLSDGTPTGR